MKQLYSDIEQLERYQRNECEETEKKQVAKRLATDQDFRDLYDDLDVLMNSVREPAAPAVIAEKIEILKATSDQLMEEPDISPASQKAPLRASEDETEAVVLSFPDFFDRYKVAIAAMIGLALAATVVFNQVTRSASPADLFTTYFEPYPNLNGQVRGEEAGTDNISRAYAAYDTKDFGEASLLFEQSDLTGERRIEHIFYQANAYLASDQAARALPLLSEVAYSDHVLNDNATWFLALAHLNLGNVAEARVLMEKIANSTPDHKKESNEILEKLE